MTTAYLFRARARNKIFHADVGWPNSRELNSCQSSFCGDAVGKTGPRRMIGNFCGVGVRANAPRNGDVADDRTIQPVITACGIEIKAALIGALIGYKSGVQADEEVFPGIAQFALSLWIERLRRAAILHLFSTISRPGAAQQDRRVMATIAKRPQSWRRSRLQSDCL